MDPNSTREPVAFFNSQRFPDIVPVSVWIRALTAGKPRLNSVAADRATGHGATITSQEIVDLTLY